MCLQQVGLGREGRLGTRGTGRAPHTTRSALGNSSVTACQPGLWPGAKGLHFGSNLVLARGEWAVGVTHWGWIPSSL